MRDNYDFSESVKNPYFDKLKQSITIDLDDDIFDYFHGISVENKIPYHNLIQLYLRDCAKQQRKLSLSWT
jgi:hypothetical protein